MCRQEKSNISPLCILFTLMPQTIPLLTLMLVYMLFKDTTPKNNAPKDWLMICTN